MPRSSRGRKRKAAEVQRACEEEEIQRRMDGTASGDERAGEEDEHEGAGEADGEDEDAVLSGEVDDEMAEEKAEQEEEQEEEEGGEEGSESGQDGGEELAGVDGGSTTLRLQLRTTEQKRALRAFPIDQPVHQSVIQFAPSAQNRRVVFGVMLTAEDGCLPPLIKQATTALKALFTRKGAEIGLYSPAIGKADRAPHARAATLQPIPKPGPTESQGDAAAAASVVPSLSAAASTAESKQTAERAPVQERPDPSGTLPSQPSAPLPAGMDAGLAAPTAMSADDKRRISEWLAQYRAPQGSDFAARLTSMMDSIQASSSLSASAATPASSTAGGTLAFAGRDAFAAHHISNLSVDLSDAIRRVGSTLNPEAAKQELHALVQLLREHAGGFAPVFGLFAAKALGDDRPDLAQLLLEQLREQNSEVVHRHTELSVEYNHMLLHLATAVSIKAVSRQLSAIGDTVAKESSATREQLLAAMSSMLTTLTQQQQQQPQQQHQQQPSQPLPPAPVLPAADPTAPPTPTLPPISDVSDSGGAPTPLATAGRDPTAHVEADDFAATTVSARVVELRWDSDTDSRLVEQTTELAAAVVQDARDRHPHMLVAASGPVDAQAAYSMTQRIA